MPTSTHLQHRAPRNPDANGKVKGNGKGKGKRNGNRNARTAQNQSLQLDCIAVSFNSTNTVSSNLFLFVFILFFLLNRNRLSNVKRYSMRCFLYTRSFVTKKEKRKQTLQQKACRPSEQRKTNQKEDYGPEPEPEPGFCAMRHIHAKIG